jgi:outer membrane lipopolysaccharide assembly protein LptE/RlpB
MKTILALCLALSLCACGVTETTTAAATGAVSKAQEIKQAGQTMENLEEKLDQANVQLQERADAANTHE